MLGGIYGTRGDWTSYVLVIPFGWLLAGALLDFIINGERTKGNASTSILCTLMILNVALILVHRDTAFIVGRILCCIGASLAIIRISNE